MLARQGFAKAEGQETVQSVTSSDDVGMTLKLERTVARVRLVRVAHAVGISAGHLSRIESGERQPSPDMVERIRIAIRAAAEAA